MGELARVVPYQGDIRLSTSYYWVNAANGCTNQMDVQEIATHEAGHIFGLKDITGQDHENLTMYAGGGYCRTKGRPLGKGDIDGLNVYN